MCLCVCLNEIDKERKKERKREKEKKKKKKVKNQLPYSFQKDATMLKALLITDVPHQCASPCCLLFPEGYGFAKDFTTFRRTRESSIGLIQANRLKKFEIQTRIVPTGSVIVSNTRLKTVVGCLLPRFSLFSWCCWLSLSLFFFFFFPRKHRQFQQPRVP